MRQRYNGYKSTFGYTPEPPKKSGKWGFICLTVTCVLIAAACFGTVGISAYSQHQAAQIAAAQQLRASQLAAVQRIMTVFPRAPHKVVKANMGNYIASGFGDSCDGEYVDQLDNTFELDATHWLAVDGNGNWALATNSTPGFADDYYVSTATSVDAPDSGTWSVVSGTGPVGTVTAVVPDAAAPTYDSATGASTNTAGTSVNVPLTEADSQPILPATGVTGYTVKVNTTDYVITTGTGATVTNTLLVPAQIYEGDTVKVKYDSGTGNVTDSSSNAMASFGWKDVTNNSTVTRTLYKPAVMLSSGRLGNLPADQQLIQPKPVPLQTLTDAATIAWDVSDAPISKAVVTLGGNRTLDVQNAVNGSQGVLFVKQDGTGSRTLTLPSNSKVSGNGSGVVTLSADASAINAIAFIYDGVDFYWNQAPGVYS